MTTPLHLYHVSCRVPKAKPGRQSVDIEIFGMAGVPPGLKPGEAAGEWQNE